MTLGFSIEGFVPFVDYDSTGVGRANFLGYYVGLQQIFDSIGYLLEFWYSDSIHLHLVFVYMEFM